MDEIYLSKVAKIAQVKYEIEYDVLISCSDIIEECFRNRYTPRRTVEVISNHLFG